MLRLYIAISFISVPPANQTVALCRPLCEDPAVAGRQTSEEKEDHSEEKHPEPLL